MKGMEVLSETVEKEKRQRWLMGYGKGIKERDVGGEGLRTERKGEKEVRNEASGFYG